MTSRHRTLIVFWVTSICVVLDQSTKWIATRHLPPGRVYSYVGDFLRLQYAENTGAFLSLGASLPEPWRHLIFTVIVGFFVVGLMLYLLISRALTERSMFALTLVGGGGVSNLIDRIANDGRVVDFLNVGAGTLRTGIFNVADMAITAGALLLLLESFQSKSSSQS